MPHSVNARKALVRGWGSGLDGSLAVDLRSAWEARPQVS